MLFFIASGRRVIESIPSGTWPLRIAVQTQHCLNLCAGSVMYEQIFTLEAILEREISKKCIFRKIIGGC